MKKCTHLDSFAMCPTSWANHPTICSVTPSGLSSASPSGNPRSSSLRTSSVPTASAASLDGASTYREYVKVNSLKMSRVWDKLRSDHILRIWRVRIKTYVDLPPCLASTNSSSFKNWVRTLVLLVRSRLRATSKAFDQSVRM